MGIKKQITVLLIIISPLMILAQAKYPKPTDAQTAWHEMEFYFFMHFGPNTFTGKEWGEGTEYEEVFNPNGLDCNQWCRIAKSAGAKGIIITAKHHDGFCLWPSKFSNHTVRESKWRNGKGDVLKELSLACERYGLKFGVYISPWDRNHPDYGTEKYNDVFVNMMKELFANYGPIWELWWDGANGEGPNGKRQVYDWKRFESTVRSISPNTVIFSDIGPDIRWCGNENGMAGITNWNTLDTLGFTRGAGSPPLDTLSMGNVNGQNWIPAECDVSIRPGWFYQKTEDDRVKTPEQLFELYLKSVGRGANLLLNVPPDSRGLIDAHDSVALLGFEKLLAENLTNNVVENANIYVLFEDSLKEKNILNSYQGTRIAETSICQNDIIQVQFKKPISINCVIIKELIEDGQSVQKFTVLIKNSKQQKKHTFSTIGRKRIITFPTMEVTDLMVYLTESRREIKIAGLEAYLIDEKLIENN